MDQLLWWTLFLILILSISVLSLYFCYNLTRDYSLNDNANVRSTPQSPQKVKLNKYKYERTDVEDLTNIEKDLRNLLPRVKLVNEVETPRNSVPSSPRGNHRRRPSLLLDIHESNVSFGSFYSVGDIMSSMGSDKEGRRGSEITSRKYNVVTEGMRRNSLAALPRKYSLMPDSSNANSTDTLDCLDPITVETKRAISSIEDDVKKVDYEISYFIGGTKNLKFYEINERLIRFNISLSDIECGSEELRQRKREVQALITDCKEKLKNKV